MSTDPMSTERNLLFGVLALQTGLIDLQQLVEAIRVWVRHKRGSLAEILRDGASLREEDERLLDGLVARQVLKHGDEGRGLASLPLDRAAREALRRLPGGEIQSSLGTWLADGPAATDGPHPAPRYRRLRFHARGGLGEVHVAEDEELGREVALKEIQPRFAGHPESVRRFVQEAEITGHLEHPGVVPVYGLVTDQADRPNYAMRFIRGESLHEAIKRFHEAEKPGRDRGERSLALRALLGRFVAVCDTVGYAHARGVAHRDIKPANVMLGAFGETLLVDWGLAKLLPEREANELPLRLSAHDPEATQLGQAMGTLAFMSPEQARGDNDFVGVESDVFSLGATLYCLLTGQPPYSGDGALERARAGEVRPARWLKPEVPAALEAVCTKAMAPWRTERYQTAQALADDVRRWLADEPVTAYRDPLPERLRRWGRRHRTFVVSGVVLLAACAAGLGVGLRAVSLEKEQTEAERDRAVKAEGAAKSNLKLAEVNLKLAKKAVDDCFNVAKEHPLFQKPQTNEAKKVLLRATWDFYKEFRARRPDDPELRREEADQFFRVGFIATELGETKEALENYQEGIALQRQLVDAHPEVTEYQRGLALMQGTLGILLTSQGKRDEALKEFEASRRRLVKLAEANPESLGIRQDLAVTLTSLGSLFAMQGNGTDSVKAYREAQRVQEELARANPKDPILRSALAVTLHNISLNSRALGQWEEAVKACTASRQLLEPLVAEHPNASHNHSALAQSHIHLGRLLADRKKFPEAAKELTQAVTLLDKLVRTHPDVPEYRRDQAGAHADLGIALADQGNNSEAIQEFQRAIDLMAQLAASYPHMPKFQFDLVTFRGNLGAMLKRQGDLPGATAQYEQVKLLLVKLTEAHPEMREYRKTLGVTLANLSHAYRQANRPNEALEAAEEALEAVLSLHRQEPGRADYRGFVMFARLARSAALDRLKRYREAIAELDEVLRLETNPAEAFSRRMARVIAMARAGDHRQASAEAERQGAGWLVPGSILYDLACVQGINAVGVLHDAATPLPARAKLSDHYARQALTLLQRAARTGFFRDPARVAHMLKDEDLTALRDRDDFRAFHRGLAPAARP